MKGFSFIVLFGLFFLLISPCDGVGFMRRRRRRAGSSYGGDQNAEETRKNSHPSEKDCEPELTHPAHGSVVCSKGNKYKSVCQYTCDEGYNLSNPESSVLTCTGQSWSGKKPVCVAVPTN